ncbi:hypothetical protein NOGI109294_08815 [Nocardiopsis gilva]
MPSLGSAFAGSGRHRTRTPRRSAAAMPTGWAIGAAQAGRTAKSWEITAILPPLVPNRTLESRAEHPSIACRQSRSAPLPRRSTDVAPALGRTALTVPGFPSAHDAGGHLIARESPYHGSRHPRRVILGPHARCPTSDEPRTDPSAPRLGTQQVTPKSGGIRPLWSTTPHDHGPGPRTGRVINPHVPPQDSLRSLPSHRIRTSQPTAAPALTAGISGSTPP